MHCGSGSCGVPRRSLAHYVTGMGPMDGADRCRRSFVLPRTSSRHGAGEFSLSAKKGDIYGTQSSWA